MDIMTSVGLACGFGVITLIMLMGGNLEMFWSEHAVIIIFGGSVAASPEPETGWFHVATNAPALVPAGPWLEFHFDRFTLPDGAIAVARTRQALQAFTYGPHLGVQFHPEFQSKPGRAHPLFAAFIAAALRQQRR